MARLPLAARLTRSKESGRSCQVTSEEAGELIDSLTTMANVVQALQSSDLEINVNAEALADAIVNILVITQGGVKAIVLYGVDGWYVCHDGSKAIGYGLTLLEALDNWRRLCNLPPVADTTLTVKGGALYDQLVNGSSGAIII